jgi:pimeloyl-ACP methyl ester carboxylesterase
MLQYSSFEVVLVHGAWADGSCWSQVISNLLDMGIRSSAAQLCLLSFDEDVAAVRRHLKTCSGKVLLVGHSYGGAVITQAGDDPRVAGLVYVAANAPAAGEPFGAFFVRKPGAYQVQLAPDEHGFIRASAQTFAEGLAGFQLQPGEISCSSRIFPSGSRA